MFKYSFFIKAIITFTCLMHCGFASACDWSPPENKVSEWVEGRVVFWGRPVKTTWDSSASNGGLANVYTTFEVAEKIQGDIPKNIRVYHSMTAANCGVSFPLGRVRLVVLSPDKLGGKFYIDASSEESVGQLILSAYFENNFDISLKNYNFRDPKKSWEALNLCESRENNTDKCNWQDKYNLALITYREKIKSLTSKLEKRWWQK